MTAAITTKKRMYEEVEKGRFGNYPVSWSTLEEVAASGYTGEVSIRSRQASNPVRLYHVPAAELAARVAALPPNHRDGGLIYCESPPDEARVLQGEWDGRHLFYSRVPKPMRYALEEGGISLWWASARHFLLRNLSAQTYDQLCELERDFPDHVIEFSEFSRPVGQLAHLGHTAFFWEVRRY